MAIDGIVLAAIGLYFSCACRANLVAIVWSYVATLAFLAFTGMAYVGSAFSGQNGVDAFPSLLLGVAALNPFVAVLPMVGQAVAIGPVHVPVVVLALVGAFLAVRVFTTAAAYRLGAYGAGCAPSLRRQTLLIVFLLSYAAIQGCMVSNKVTSAFSGVTIAEVADDTALGLIAVFLAGTPFLAGLFTPARLEDAPPGAAQSAADASAGGYDLRRAFRPVHRGALPYFHFLILATVGGTVLALWGALGLAAAQFLGVFGSASVFIAGLGLLYWSVSWFMATVVTGVSRARALAFGAFATLLLLPMLPIALTSGDTPWNTNPLATAWLLYPLIVRSNATAMDAMQSELAWMPLCAAQAVCWAVPFVALAAWRERRPAATQVAFAE
jgi:hypothetical protein